MNANSLLASPTGLSPYLRFGCLSCRLFYYRLWELYKKVRQKAYLESRLVLSIDSTVMLPDSVPKQLQKLLLPSLCLTDGLSLLLLQKRLLAEEK